LSLHRRTNALFTQASAQLETLGGKLNQLTGYDEIEGLKRQVREREAGIALLQAAARGAKKAYETAVTSRSACQREVNDLLQRKSMWTEQDVSRFTELVRQDHANEQAELSAKAAVGKAEEEVERGQTALMQTILHRYHEEQVWSDKIRSASTYGSLVALGLNMVVFVLAVIAVEPWKRKRLAQTFEKRVVEMTGEMEGVVKQEVGELSGRLGEMERLLAQ
ncbi:mitochondrial distribution and morphology family 33, partial [Calocera viscosa TUFC12733]